MAKYNVHAGHNSIVPGAGKYLDEVAEDRKVKNEVISLLKSAGNTVYDCTDDKGRTQGANLANIVAKCNAHSVDLDISIHLNAGGGTGVEVYYYGNDSTGKAKAAAVSEKVAKALGLKNRGAKSTTSLYVLSNTKATAILVECCFVDNKTDAAAWDAGKCARAIVEGVTVKAVSSSSSGGSNAYHGGTPGKYWATVQLYSPNQTDAQKWIVHKHSDGKYSIKNKACSLYLDVKSAKTTNETLIQVYSWNNTKAQRFELEIGGADGVGEETVIRSVLDRNMAVDVKGAGTANGTKIQLYKFNDSSAQKWNFVPAGGEDEYYIINSVSGKALDVKGGGK